MKDFVVDEDFRMKTISRMTDDRLKNIKAEELKEAFSKMDGGDVKLIVKAIRRNAGDTKAEEELHALQMLEASIFIPIRRYIYSGLVEKFK